MKIWIVARQFGEQLWKRSSDLALKELTGLIKAHPDSKFIFFSMDVPEEVQNEHGRQTDAVITKWLFDGQFDPFES